jgi:hypothetical protein
MDVVEAGGGKQRNENVAPKRKRSKNFIAPSTHSGAAHQHPALTLLIVFQLLSLK